jgi:fructose-1,6-bisphosphatase/inositol monophosphatase family enzyme
MRETAEAELLPRFGKLEKSEIREKTPGDLVTVADVAAERRLTEGLNRILPGVVVVGEEAVAADPKLIKAIKSEHRAWVVDPLDGTSNFAAGKPRFAVIVALTEKGRTIGGWIYDPLGARSAATTLGGGAWLNGEKVRFAANTPLGEMSGYVGYKFKRQFLEKANPERIQLVKGMSSLFCAGLEYIEMLAGNSHFNLYRFVKPWDHAAGTLMVEEAGGHAAHFNGDDYRPTVHQGGVLAATDPAAWHELHRLFLAEQLPLLDMTQDK